MDNQKEPPIKSVQRTRASCAAEKNDPPQNQEAGEGELPPRNALTYRLAEDDADWVEIIMCLVLAAWARTASRAAI